MPRGSSGRCAGVRTGGQRIRRFAEEMEAANFELGLRSLAPRLDADELLALTERLAHLEARLAAAKREALGPPPSTPY
jgi:hypothetical protein